MTMLTLAAGLLVLSGAALMLSAIVRGRKIDGIVPPELKRQWRMMAILMIFFLAGYLAFAVLLIEQEAFPQELVTGSVFLGGAFFVFIVINLTRDTVARMRSAEEALKVTNESLERRVVERTRDLEQSRAFLRTVLDSLNDEVLIVDVGTYRIQDANESFLVRHGLILEEAIGKTCHELTHHRIDVCSPPDDLCPLRETVETGRFSAAEHVHAGKDGKRMYAEVSTSPIRGGNGDVHQVVHVTRDITMRKRADEAVRRSEKKYRDLFDSTLDGIFQVNAEGVFTLMNKAGARIFGYESPEEIIARNALEYWRDPRDREAYREELKKRKVVSAYPMKARKRTGEHIELESSSRIIEDANGVFLGIEGILRDMTDRKRLEEELRSLSLRDELTGLYNRRGFITLAAQELRMADRLKRGIYILYADLDGLKGINDTMGHKEGDRAIQETADILKETFRNSDVIGRIGGDEFVIIPIGAAGDNIPAITGRLQENLDARNRQAGRSFILSLSIGVSYYDPGRPVAIEKLLVEADALMYEQKKAKRAGAGRESPRSSLRRSGGAAAG